MSRAAEWIALLAIAAAGLALAGRTLSTPGLYYDEAVQARPALEFLEGERRGTPLPGSHSRPLFERPFPVTTQLYMGALKSQLLIPPFGLFGASAPVLRAATIAWALMGVVLAAVWARRVFDRTTGLALAALLVFDPSFLLAARHDWGSFALSFALRSAALLAAWHWWETRRAWPLCAAGLAVGLAGYNKVDAAIGLAAAALAVTACAGRPVWAALRSRPALVAGAAAALLVGLAPLLGRLGAILSAGSALAASPQSGEKLRTLWTALDGSYFSRLMQTGGLFERMHEIESAPAGIFGWLAIASAAWLGAVAFRSRGGEQRRALFVLLAAGLSLLGVLALPGAVRLHHALNVLPYPHLLVAFAFSTALARARSTALRGLVAVALAGTLLLQLSVFQRSFAWMTETGGLGRWSNAVFALARDIEEASAERVVSLDWGVHEPLAFLVDGPPFVEAPLAIAAGTRRTGVFSLDGTPGQIYVTPAPPYDLFGYGGAFVEAAEALRPALATIRRYRDRRGGAAIVAVQFSRPHQIVYYGERCEIRF